MGTVLAGSNLGPVPTYQVACITTAVGLLSMRAAHVAGLPLEQHVIRAGLGRVAGDDGGLLGACGFVHSLDVLGQGVGEDFWIGVGGDGVARQQCCCDEVAKRWLQALHIGLPSAYALV